MVLPLPGRSILYRPEILEHPPFLGAYSLSASHPSFLLRCLQAAVYVTPEEELLPSDQPLSPPYLALTDHQEFGRKQNCHLHCRVLVLQRPTVPSSSRQPLGLGML